MEEGKKAVIEAGHRLLETGLIARTWGNVSARISDTQFVITPSGRTYDTLTPDDIVVVNIDDCSYEGDELFLVFLSRLELVAQFLETFHKGECLVYMIFLYHFACFIG